MVVAEKTGVVLKIGEIKISDVLTVVTGGRNPLGRAQGLLFTFAPELQSVGQKQYPAPFCPLEVTFRLSHVQDVTPVHILMLLKVCMHTISY